MSSKKEPAPEAPAAMEASVVQYLRAHPDFFVRHPSLLAELHVPHDCGGAVSLVEHQVGVLRDQVRDGRRRMQGLIRNARENEELARRMHRLTLTLLDCTSLDEALASLYHALAEDLKGEFAAVRLFTRPRAERDRGLGEFVGRDARGLQLFAHVLASTKPVCGRVKGEQVEFLFPGHGTEIASAALLPLGSGERVGVLAIASRDPQRFHPGMGTLFLRQLGELVSHVLAPYCAARLEPRSAPPSEPG